MIGWTLLGRIVSRGRDTCLTETGAPSGLEAGRDRSERPPARQPLVFGVRYLPAPTQPGRLEAHPGHRASGPGGEMACN
jgi:hypothetical protein